VIRYEWIVETLDDRAHFDRLAEAKRYAVDKPCHDIALVRDVFDAVDQNLNDRQWAYLEDGKMPAAFDGGAAVPKTFIDEVTRAL